MRLPSNVIIPLGLSEYDGNTALVYASKRRGHSKLSLATSADGIHFSESIDAPVIFTGSNKSEHIGKTTDYRFSQVLGDKFLTYSKSGRLVIARQGEEDDLWDLAIWRTVRTATPRAVSGMLVPEFKYNNQFVLYYNTSEINVAITKDFKTWHGPSKAPLRPRKDNFDSRPLHIISVGMVSKGILVVYETTKTRRKQQFTDLGMALFARNDPAKLLWRCEGPVWQSATSARDPITIVGAQIYEREVHVYGTSKSGGLFLLKLPQPLYVDEIRRPIYELARHHANPIIAPEGGADWEQVGTFNPTILHHDDRIHILYRAVDPFGVSYVGYATSPDGFNIDYRSPVPAYWPRAAFEAGFGKRPYKAWSTAFGSGGGWGGCEDPKVTLIDDRVYMTYVAHDGSPSLRMALTSIELNDFLDQKWNKWEWPRIISTPKFGSDVNPPFGVSISKSGVILPKKISGKYVIFHRTPPHVRIHYTESLERLGIDEELGSHAEIHTRPHAWDSQKMSIGSTPIETDEGWLVIYHAVDRNESSKYKIGAMLLDASDPSKVLKRTNTPILEPEMAYENEWKYGVTYPSGAAVIGDQLHVYYGGGDRHVCVATTPFKDFMGHLMNEEEVHLSEPVMVR